MSNFDLRKFLAEGKLYEEATSTEEAMDKPSTKMKMSELKKKIRQEILSELTLSEDSEVDFNISDPDKFYSPVAEATKDGDGEVPSKDKDTDIDIVDKEKVDVDVEEKPKVTGVDGEFLDQLEDLKDEADSMGDNKLERQIDNTITYFTRQHIAKDTNESIELEEDFGPAVQSTDPKAREIEDKLDKDGNLRKQIAQLMAQAEKGGDTSGLLGKMTGLFETDELEETDDMALVADLEAELTEGYSEFQRVDKGKKKTAAKNKAEEEVYGAGVKKGEKIEKKKLKTTMNENLTPLQQYVYNYEVEISGEDNANDELENIKNLKDVDDVYNYYADYRGWEQDRDFQYDLKRLYRTLVKKFPKTTVNESLEILKMKKLAGLLTEGEYAKALLNEAKEDEVPLTSKVKSFINKAISDAKKDGKFEDLKKADWFENELIDMLIELFKDKDYDRASKEVKDYIKSKITMKNESLLKEGEYAKALLKEGDFNTFNNVMAILNQLSKMGEEGERVFDILERIPEWNELVRDNQDIDM